METDLDAKCENSYNHFKDESEWKLPQRWHGFVTDCSTDDIRCVGCHIQSEVTAHTITNNIATINLTL